MRRLWSLLRNYWVRVIAVAAIGVFVSSYLDKTHALLNIRYHISEFLQGLNPRGEDAQRTVLVLITDEEYWKELHGRVPIRRDYLARIVRRATEFRAAVIALDFDFRLTSGGAPEPPEFQKETMELRNAIYDASTKGIKVVLTRTLGQASDGAYMVESDVYGDDVLSWPNIGNGYHVLSDDVRELPLVLSTANASRLDSFALAIARADQAPSLKRIKGDADYYSGFLEADAFPKITADELLKGTPNGIANRVLLVSGIWHQDGYQRGATVRAWDSPVGTIAGVLIHANYFEAIFDKRFYRLLEGWPVKGIEFLLSLMVAIPFHVKFTSRWKALLMIVAPYVVIAIVSYVLLIALAWFFDPSIPLVAVALHGIYERVHFR
jgi:CHASE2 domain-containing sensor protein